MDDVASSIRQALLAGVAHGAGEPVGKSTFARKVLDNEPYQGSNGTSARRRRHLAQLLRGGPLLSDLDERPDDAQALEPGGKKIPRVIHFLWKTATLPRFAETYKRSWLEHHPGWKAGLLYSHEFPLQLTLRCCCP